MKKIFLKKNIKFLSWFMLSIILSSLFFFIFLNKNNQNQTEEGLLQPTKKISIIKTYPKEPSFTQGLEYLDGKFYESSGLYGESSLKKTDAQTGKVEKMVLLPEKYFAERLTIYNDKIYQLTWKGGRGFIYDLTTLEREKEFSILNSEGWGLENKDDIFYRSNGTSLIDILDPTTMEKINSLQITYKGRPVDQLNELEFVEDKLYANIWQTNYIVVIDYKNGIVEDIINASSAKNNSTENKEVLNGIAYDEKNNALYITGKNWENIYEVAVEYF